MFVLLLEDSVKEELCKVNCEVKREELVPVSLLQHFVVASVIEESKPDGTCNHLFLKNKWLNLPCVLSLSGLFSQ